MSGPETERPVVPATLDDVRAAVGASSSYLGDLTAIDGISGAVTLFGSVLPVGGLPSLSFDGHYQGLIYGGGYDSYGWYRGCDSHPTRWLGAPARA